MTDYLVLLAMLVSLGGMLGGMAWLSRGGSARAGAACAACGYDMRALPEGSTCPECGRERATTPLPPSFRRDLRRIAAPAMSGLVVLALGAAAIGIGQGLGTAIGLAALSSAFATPTFVLFTLIAMPIGRRLGRRRAVFYVSSVSLGGALAGLLVLLDVVVWNPDPQGGIAILFIGLPIVMGMGVGSAAGIGLAELEARFDGPG